MGYTTWFEGELTPNKPFKKEFINYINAFSGKRHEPRDVEIIKRSDPDWAKHCLDGNLGPCGMYYVGSFDEGIIGHSFNKGIIDHHTLAKGYTCPGYWCNWYINEETGVVEWDEGEKFYNYIEWLKFLIDNFFEPAGYKLNGEIFWEGEEREDTGVIVVKDNLVYSYNNSIVYFNYDKENEKILGNFSDRQLLDELIKRGIIM